MWETKKKKVEEREGGREREKRERRDFLKNGKEVDRDLLHKDSFK